jgi:monoamine oxidase
LGSYSYYGVGTNRGHIRQLQKNLNQKVFFIGEHVNPRFSSNVHGAFDSGKNGAGWAADSLSDRYILMSILVLYLILITI